jgi:hypothetical protein
VRASEFSAQAMGKLSLDFISVKVQTERARSANASKRQRKAFGLSVRKLIHGTRSSVPRRSLRRRPGEGNSRGRIL